MGWKRLMLVMAALPVLNLALGCKISSESTPAQTVEVPPKPEYVEQIELAYGAGRYAQKQAVEADFVVEFGGSTLIEGTMLFNREVSKARMTLADGTILVFDGNNAWVTPEDSAVQMARFHLLTWPYFLAAPMKLADTGVMYEEVGEVLLTAEQSYPGLKLTFASGVGDAPDDWYILMKDPDTDALRAMAYIVTYNKTKEEAEASPSVIEYAGFKTVDGVAFATDWTFSYWDPEQGKMGKPKGHATISNIRFVEPERGTFAPPLNARIDELPVVESPVSEPDHGENTDSDQTQADDAE
ncbi:DUF6503 family protein [Mucisphaera calidilacus]|uniref:Outer membrane lipoprotein-sorting protein n=1 Tax=Mucisphaera calidilacus TaxID=2527982 RepID=A0A518BWA9_9BACT|nr:DUF6503 family protein [Mucisphaera calidilacus]QDU71257.1 hypothetical protein Pan265_11060 [Mucisphaera calidilacus]